MSEQVKCPSSSELEQIKSECVVCGGKGSVDKTIHDRFEDLAKKLRDETQIPHQYFEIESLLLYNVSSSQDSNCYQEYAVYKRGEDGGYTKVESLTVNAPTTKLSKMVSMLKTINKQPISAYADFLAAYNDSMTAEEFEAFKQRFATFAANY